MPVSDIVLMIVLMAISIIAFLIWCKRNGSCFAATLKAKAPAPCPECEINPVKNSPPAGTGAISNGANKPETCADCPPAPQRKPEIVITLTPNNPPEIPVGIFCTRTKSITAFMLTAGIDDLKNITKKWFVNNILAAEGTAEYTGIKRTGDTLKFVAGYGGMEFPSTEIKIK